MPRCRILVAGDDAETLESLAAGLRADGYAVDTAPSARGALERARHRDYAVSVLDFAGEESFETIQQMRRLRPQCCFIGSRDDISIRVNGIVQLRNLQRENAGLRAQLARQLGTGVRICAGMRLNEMEKVLIAATIQHTHGNIKEAASVLGIDRSTLYEKIRRYGIPR
jgi:DNA-binding NtrC family response regulator